MSSTVKSKKKMKEKDKYKNNSRRRVSLSKFYATCSMLLPFLFCNRRQKEEGGHNFFLSFSLSLFLRHSFSFLPVFFIHKDMRHFSYRFFSSSLWVVLSSHSSEGAGGKKKRTEERDQRQREEEAIRSIMMNTRARERAKSTERSFTEG